MKLTMFPLYLIISKPDSFRIFLAASTFWPSSRTTSGISRLSVLHALTTPLAMMEQSTMPPKTLTNIAFTFLSSLIMRNASFT